MPDSDANAEAISLTDDEREQLWQSGEVSIINCDPESNLVRAIERIIANRARLAGAGAQVTEAAELTDAEIDELGKELDSPNQVYKLDSIAALCNEFLSRRHMGTGQSEADLREQVAAEIEDEAASGRWSSHWTNGLLHAAGIARRALLDRPAAEGDNA